jgi:hypothetical protein
MSLNINVLRSEDPSLPNADATRSFFSEGGGEGRTFVYKLIFKLFKSIQDTIIHYKNNFVWNLMDFLLFSFLSVFIFFSKKSGYGRRCLQCNLNLFKSNFANFLNTQVIV